MTRKRLDKEERKRQIKDAAIRLMAKNGYQDTSVQDIVEAADFSKGGFYNCYSSKDELFKEILNDGMDYRANLVLKTKRELIEDRKSFLIEALLDKILDYNDYKKLVCNAIIEGRRNSDFWDYYFEYSKAYSQYFIEFCEKEGFEEYITLSNEAFGYFMSSLIIGNDLLDQYGNENYRDLLRTILVAYFEKINLFKNL